MTAHIYLISRAALMWNKTKSSNAVIVHSSDLIRNPHLSDFSEPTLPAKFALTDWHSVSQKQQTLGQHHHLLLVDSGCVYSGIGAAAGCKYSYISSSITHVHYRFSLFPSLSTVYDLLTSPDCLPDLLQGGLAEQGVNEAFILTSFKLQPKTGTSVFSLYNPRDNSKYFEFTVMGKLNRGRRPWKRLSGTV